jgi:hypothetical protein
VFTSRGQHVWLSSFYTNKYISTILIIFLRRFDVFYTTGTQSQARTLQTQRFLNNFIQIRYSITFVSNSVSHTTSTICTVLHLFRSFLMEAWWWFFRPQHLVIPESKTSLCLTELEGFVLFQSMSRHFMTFIFTSIIHYSCKNNAIVDEYYSIFECDRGKWKLSVVLTPDTWVLLVWRCTAITRSYVFRSSQTGVINQDIILEGFYHESNV